MRNILLTAAAVSALAAPAFAQSAAPEAPRAAPAAPAPDGSEGGVQEGRGGAAAERTLDPVGLVHAGQAWYLMALRDGERRTVVEMDIDEIGPALRFATASVYRAQRESAAPRAADAPRNEAPAEPVEAAAAPRSDLVGAGVGPAAPPF